MDSSTIIFLTALAAIVFWSFKKAKKADEVQTPNVDTPLEPKPANPLKILTPEEEEVEKASQVERQGQAEREKAYSEHKRELKAAEDKIEKANEYIRKSGLDFAVPFIWQQMKHWPSWLVNQNGKWACPVPVSDVSGENQGIKSGSVTWRWDGDQFAVKFEKWENYGPFDDDTELATFTVEFGGQEVANLTFSNQIFNEFGEWRFVSVDGLKVGPWMSRFMAYCCVLRAQKEAESANCHADYIKNRAAKIDLGEE